MKRLRTALLISGGGTTAEAILEAVKNGSLQGIEPVVVIASVAGAYGLTRVEKYNIPSVVVNRKEFSTASEFGEELLSVLKKYDVDLVSQNGWLPLTPLNVISAYHDKIINQHPGRLPEFGGKGMYGSRVTCATLAYFRVTHEENPWTASVVHFVTSGFDEGAIISSKKMPLDIDLATITLSELTHDPSNLMKQTRDVQRTLLRIEHENVIEALSRFATGRVLMVKQHKSLDTKFSHILAGAKTLAIQLFPNG